MATPEGPEKLPPGVWQCHCGYIMPAKLREELGGCTRCLMMLPSCKSYPTMRESGEAADRQYHGGMFYSGEW